MNADRQLRQQWDEIDLDRVGLWRHLIRHGLTFTAEGLLRDLADRLHQAEEIQREGRESGEREYLSEWELIEDDLVKNYRQEFMDIITSLEIEDARWQDEPFLGVLKLLACYAGYFGMLKREEDSDPDLNLDSSLEDEEGEEWKKGNKED